MDIAVVVVTYNKPDSVTKLVEGLRKHYSPDLELVVVDDGSDPRPDIEHLCKYVWQEDLGNRVGAARNLGFTLTTKPKVAFFDDDVLVHPLCLQAHSLALEMYDISAGLLPQGEFSPELDERTMFYFRKQVIGWKFAWTGNLAVRRTTFEKVGGFDTAFDSPDKDTPAHGYEDWDWARRASRDGHRIMFNELAMAMHEGAQTWKEAGAGTLRNKAVFEEKWNTKYEDPLYAGRFILPGVVKTK
jgi:GT2 family glycosyltransferase